MVRDRNTNRIEGVRRDFHDPATLGKMMSSVRKTFAGGDRPPPEIARSVAEPISSINDVRIYGNTGDGISQISGQVPTVIKQTMDTVADATGVDMTKIIEQSTLESAVKRTADKPEK